MFRSGTFSTASCAALSQWRTEGFWRPGRRWELAPLLSACQTGKRKSALPRYWGYGAEPHAATNAFGTGEQLGVNGSNFWSVNTIFNFLCQTGKRRRRSAALPCYWGSGARPQPPTLLGAYGCKWNPFLNSLNIIFNYRRVKLARSESVFLCFSGAEPQPPTLLGLGSNWEWMESIFEKC